VNSHFVILLSSCIVNLPIFYKYSKYYTKNIFQKTLTGR
jgi:hypothetical protein